MKSALPPIKYKKRVGRPNIPIEEKKDCAINIKLNRADFARISEFAKLNNIKISNLLRRLILHTFDDYKSIVVTEKLIEATMPFKDKKTKSGLRTSSLKSAARKSIEEIKHNRENQLSIIKQVEVDGEIFNIVNR